MPRVKPRKLKTHCFKTKAKTTHFACQIFPFTSSFTVFPFPLLCLFFFNCLRRNNEFAHIKLKSSSSLKMPRSFAFLFSRMKLQTLTFKDYYTNGCNTLQKTLLPLSHSQICFFIANPPILSRQPPRQPFSFLLQRIRQRRYPRKLPELLFPSWRNSLEISFLFHGME